MRKRSFNENYNENYNYNENRAAHWLLSGGKVLVLVLVLVLSSCSQDETSVASYRTDLVCLISNGDSVVSTLLLDNGKHYDVSSQKLRAGYANDTVRCISAFMINADSLTAHVYETKQISCYAPLPIDSFKIHPHDPVNVKSVWKSGGYINMYLACLTNGSAAKNQYDFSSDSLTSHTLHVSLLFKRDTTALEAYTKTFYHSLPLHSPDYKQDFDSLTLYINTYDGLKTYSFKR